MIIGLTGGIGSGKSEVSRRFADLGIVIVDADVVARDVVAPKSAALTAIAAHFGDRVLTDDKLLNRAELRNIIFSNPIEKFWLENLLHPLIRTETIKQLEAADSPYVILTSPLLLETTQHELVDRILVVDADEQVQLQRASARDNNSAEQIQKIMSTQMARAERCAKAHDIIHNNGDLNELDQQIKQLHENYLTLTNHSTNQ